MKHHQGFVFIKFGIHDYRYWFLVRRKSNYVLIIYIKKIGFTYSYFSSYQNYFHELNLFFIFIVCFAINKKVNECYK